MCEMKKWNGDGTPCHCLYHWACDDAMPTGMVIIPNKPALLQME